MRLEIIEVARKKRIDEELTRKSDVMEGQLKTVKQKVKELERQIAKSKLANPCITKEPFEPRGKVFNFASQTKHNPESYREVPEGARGHMVVVLDTAQHGGTCKVWVVTVSIYTEIHLTILTKSRSLRNPGSRTSISVQSAQHP